MPYRYLTDVAIADIAFEARADTLEELFSVSVDAVLGVMVRAPDRVGAGLLKLFEAREKAADLLLLALLQEIVFYKDAEGILLRCPAPLVREDGEGFELRTELRGERIDSSRHELLADVKAVTLHLLKVERLPEGWLSRVVLDV
jgi:SHS2 domain-containing protein